MEKRMEHRIEVAPGIELWVEERGAGTPLVLVMGANASGVGWPDELVDRLATQHRVIRYDHRDTGRSSWAFAERPYPLTELAEDLVKVLDALDIPAAHLVGMSLGGTLVQVLLLDHPERILSATIFATAALTPWAEELPGPTEELMQLWGHLADERNPKEELAFRTEHWRLLNGGKLAFDEAWFRGIEQRIIEHTGHDRSSDAHALADQSGLDRGPELAAVTVATLVVEAPEDPINPPPHGRYLASAIGGARLTRIDGMGHALPQAVLEPLAAIVLEFTGKEN